MFEGVTTAQLIDCTFGRWSPGIGDPSIVGWLTVLAYLVTGALSAVVALRPMRRRRGRRAERAFWAILSVLMLALAVNKQLDLQSFVTAVGRCISQIQGWYDQRRAVQARVIVGIIAVLSGLLLLSVFSLRHSLRRNGLAIFGLGIVAIFVSVRAVGFTHVDALIGYTMQGVRMNWALELSGLILISINAIARLTRRRRHEVGRWDHI